MAPFTQFASLDLYWYPRASVKVIFNRKQNVLKSTGLSNYYNYVNTKNGPPISRITPISQVFPIEIYPGGSDFRYYPAPKFSTISVPRGLPEVNESKLKAKCEAAAQKVARAIGLAQTTGTSQFVFYHNSKPDAPSFDLKVGYQYSASEFSEETAQTDLFVLMDAKSSSVVKCVVFISSGKQAKLLEEQKSRIHSELGIEVEVDSRESQFHVAFAVGPRPLPATWSFKNE